MENNRNNNYIEIILVVNLLFSLVMMAYMFQIHFELIDIKSSCKELEESLQSEIFKNDFLRETNERLIEKNKVLEQSIEDVKKINTIGHKSFLKGLVIVSAVVFSCFFANTVNTIIIKPIMNEAFNSVCFSVFKISSSFGYTGIISREIITPNGLKLVVDIGNRITEIKVKTGGGQLIDFTQYIDELVANAAVATYTYTPLGLDQLGYISSGII